MINGIGQQPTNPPILSPSTLSILPHLCQSMRIAAQAPARHGVWMVEDAVASDEFLAWHGCGWRRTQPPVTRSGMVRSVDSGGCGHRRRARRGAWRRRTRLPATSSDVGRGSEGRGRRRRPPTWGVDDGSRGRRRRSPTWSYPPVRNISNSRAHALVLRVHFSTRRRPMDYDPAHSNFRLSRPRERRNRSKVRTHQITHTGK